MKIEKQTYKHETDEKQTVRSNGEIYSVFQVFRLNLGKRTKIIIFGSLLK